MIMKLGIVCNAGRVKSRWDFAQNRKEITQAMINQRELILSDLECPAQFEKPFRNGRKTFKTEGIATTFIKFSEIEKVFQYMDNPVPEVKKMVILFD